MDTAAVPLKTSFYQSLEYDKYLSLALCTATAMSSEKL